MPTKTKSKAEDKCIIKALMDKVEELKFENLELQAELDALKKQPAETKKVARA